MRTVFRGGTVFDGTGAAPAVADVVIDDGTIVEVGPGLDGDEAVDCAGMHVLPGLFDCHTHFTASGDRDVLRRVSQPFSLRYYVAVQSMEATLRCGVTSVRIDGQRLV